jgi:hypothetical protein
VLPSKETEGFVNFAEDAENEQILRAAILGTGATRRSTAS